MSGENKTNGVGLGSQTEELRHTQHRRGFLTSSAAIVAALATAKNSFANSLPFQNQEANKQPESDADFQELAEFYSLEKGLGYLNHASIGCVPIPVQKARAEYLRICESNPWLHIWGDAWKAPLDSVRQDVAGVMGCDSEEIAITHNTTEMFNTLANGLPLEAEDEVLFSSLCHSGACIPFSHRAELGMYKARRFDFPVSLLPSITAQQVVDAYMEQVTDATKVLVVPHLDNTVGILYPIKQLAAAAREKGVEFIVVDAAQTVGMLPVDCHDLGVDVVATSGHKWLGGPKGTGLAYVNKRLTDSLNPLVVTWGQRSWSTSARKFEDYGTRNLPEALTLGNAIEFIQQIEPARREKRLKDLWTFTRGLVEQSDSLKWNSPDTWAMSGSLYSIRVEKPAARLAKELFEENKIVLRPFGTLGLNNLRVSPNVFTTKAEIQKLIGLVS